ncbi:hypothetical protein [Xanthomonas phaseoli]|uniref:hypothetical protein n=1 Tax=Xanthomonas phaseoli TaxID=1985254 RepID=UPI001AD998EC|nr:hypothetical protein [Xanthomonas phaseoli]MBO9831392.1 hypothetical protein [Xanthomonas phaseoli pv. dieffenbachiae]MBO9837727.1 hypothetical protein [Xanthomonas phaseoli pv. dieffenbachiae]MBO9839033.1 hypothetical protein [Xanthomonas phaseoli pv. dieffenbachiae]MBO9861362.1 hypothetical protein [Xanthomonas phaseoli pv. dieffenbachiae]MBO9865238.1 hypothetical protein [Xanthomonas phaseoli pv. dieffenbachiae]
MERPGDDAAWRFAAWRFAASTLPQRCPVPGSRLDGLLSLASLASGATALLVVHLQIFLARELLGGIVVLAVLLALGHAVRIVGDVIGLLALLAHGVGPLWSEAGP